MPVLTATTTNFAASNTSQTLIPSDTGSGANGRIIYNDSTVNLRIKFGATASASSFTVLIPPATAYEFPSDSGTALYVGQVDGIWDSATGNARVTVW